WSCRQPAWHSRRWRFMYPGIGAPQRLDGFRWRTHLVEALSDLDLCGEPKALSSRRRENSRDGSAFQLQSQGIHAQCPFLDGMAVLVQLLEQLLHRNAGKFAHGRWRHAVCPVVHDQTNGHGVEFLDPMATLRRHPKPLHGSWTFAETIQFDDLGVVGRTLRGPYTAAGHS